MKRSLQEFAVSFGCLTALAGVGLLVLVAAVAAWEWMTWRAGELHF